MCGLCGNYDSSPANDFTKPDGTIATTVNDFGNSWQTKEDEDDSWVCMLFLLLPRQARDIIWDKLLTVFLKKDLWIFL